MAKKTKKEKIQSEKRRIAFSYRAAAPIQTHQAIPSESVNPTAYHYASTGVKKEVASRTDAPLEALAIRRDLLKTTLLAVLAFSFEFFLYTSNIWKK